VMMAWSWISIGSLDESMFPPACLSIIVLLSLCVFLDL
jgi:hypothetical protein